MTTSDGTISWRQLLLETAAIAGRREARWLCEEASGAFGPEFDDSFDRPAGGRAVAHLDAMLARVRAGEPLQYVLGHWSFRRLDLMVDRRVLIPRPETEMVAEVAIGLARSLVGTAAALPLTLVDLGTGSGAIGLSLAAELPRDSATVWLTDVSLDALDVARANLAGLGAAGASVRFGHGSWFEALPTEMRGQVALVVSNPPYIAATDPALEASVRDWEPALALFAADEGLAHLGTVAREAVEWLVPGGWLVLEIGYRQGPAVAALLEEQGLSAVEVRTDLAGHDRIAVAQK